MDALCELKTRKVLALAMATTEQIELDKNRPYPMKLKSEARGRIMEIYKKHSYSREARKLMHDIYKKINC